MIYSSSESAHQDESNDNSDHYETFANLYGKLTTEKFCSSLINLNSKTELAPSNILISTKIKDYIKCNSYEKIQCLYSELKLTEQEKQDLEFTLQIYTYFCGSLIFLDDYSLVQKVFVKIQISCDSLIELLYYISKKAGNIPICYWCDVNN
ncbi:hypothetical protein RhiirA1_473900 [Rhizophagus irregularis]|uniref:Uncharacterized protein n=1 Tax=Rhizophagus irregularis TaxID=588596 RepID=A0A2N0QZS2_9GLOM|nr:hypothetical protein RhiirA1_473900 [Rhizophagus irregularis]